MDNKELVTVLKALGDEHRLKILQLMLDEEKCVCEIIEQIELSQPTISHHLKVLKNADIILDRKEGKWVIYRPNKEKINEFKSFFDNNFLEKILSTEYPPKKLPDKCRS
jgi:ArsR family transcriptional regulator